MTYLLGLIDSSRDFPSIYVISFIISLYLILLISIVKVSKKNLPNPVEPACGSIHRARQRRRPIRWRQQAAAGRLVKVLPLPRVRTPAGAGAASRRCRHARPPSQTAAVLPLHARCQGCQWRSCGRAEPIGGSVKSINGDPRNGRARLRRRERRLASSVP